jgi:hypothetical protein
MPAVSSLPQLAPQTSSAGSGAATVIPTVFGSALAKALAAPAQADEPPATTDAATAPPAEAAAWPLTPVAPATSAATSQAVPAAPAQATADTAPSATEASPPTAETAALTEEMAPATTETVPAVRQDTATGKKVAARDTEPVRRGAARVAPRQAATDQPAVLAPAASSLSVASSPPVAAGAGDGSADAARPAVSQAHAVPADTPPAAKPATAAPVATKTAAVGTAAGDTPQPVLPAQEPPAAASPQPADASSAGAAAPQPPAEPAQQATAPATTPPASATTPTRPTSPAEQLAPALVRIGHASDGAQRLTVSLNPPELGHVQVRIERPSEAPARVAITVEKAETLTLLLRDQPQLQRALDQAGVPAEGRSVTFHVAPADPAPHSEPGPAATQGVAAGGQSGDGSHGATRNGGQPAHRQAGGSADAETEFVPATAPRWIRAGLDITA